MENFYKQHFLKDISIHAELLIYDWTAGGETEVVVEDIERIDFDAFEEDPMEKKMMDWRFPNEVEWCEARIKYASQKADLMNYFNIPRFDVPELLRDAESSKIYRDVWYNVSICSVGYQTKKKKLYLLFSLFLGSRHEVSPGL